MKKITLPGYVKPRSPVNHYLIFDRSGSMYGTLSQLIDNVIQVQKEIPDGDSLSIAWFSSQGGQYEWLLKAHIVGPKTDEFLSILLSRYRSTVGMTCFSEVLSSMEEAVKITSTISNYHSLMFFTDGFPVVSDLKKETDAIVKSLSSLPITHSLFVGYGSYYNKEFMARMAGLVNGSVVSANNVQEVATAYLDFIGQSNPLVMIKMEGSQAFYFTPDGFYPLKVENNVAYVPSGAHHFYTDAPGDDPIEAQYALALSYMKAYKADKALEVLTNLGDIALVNRLSDAFTDEEYAEVERGILEAANYHWARFVGGKRPNFISPHSTCVLDILEILATDNANFYPGESKYKRIGAPQVKRGGYPDFVMDTVEVQMNKLVFNGERANVSIQTSVCGTIPVDYEGLNEKTLPVSQFRTYTVIKDGRLNMGSITVGLKNITFQALKKAGVVSGRYKTKVVIDLTRFPLINRQVTTLPSIQGVISLKDEEILLEARQKVLKWMLPEDAIKPSETYPSDVCDYLASIGVNPTTMVYNPPSDKGETKDKYIAMRVQFKKKGFSSLPSVDSVIEAQKSGRALTASQELIWEEYQGCKTLIEPVVKLDPVGLQGLPENALMTTKKRLVEIRIKLARVIFAIVVGKKWFSDLSERDGAKVGDYTIALNTVEVEI